MLPREPRTISLMLVGNQLLRAGLSALFEKRTDIRVVGEAGDKVSAVEEALRLTPDIIVLDSLFPGISDTCREISAGCPSVRMLFLTSADDEEGMLVTVLTGGHGFVLKDIDCDMLVNSIRMVAAGYSILPPAATRSVLELMQSLAMPSLAGHGEPLSSQEQRVLAEVAEGKSNKQIAQALNLSEKTVKNYLSKIFRKLHIRSRSQAVARFMGQKYLRWQ